MNTIDSMLDFLGKRVKKPFANTENVINATYSGASFTPDCDGVCSWVGNPSTTDYAYMEVADDGTKIGFAESTRGREMSVTLPVRAGVSYTVTGDNCKGVSRYFFPIKSGGN